MQQEQTRVSIQPKMDCVADAVELVREMKAECWGGFKDEVSGYMTEVKQRALDIPVFRDRGRGNIIAIAGKR